jgi:prophage regulatory protein
MTHWKDCLDPNVHGGGRYLPWKEVARTTGLSRTTAWRLQKRGEFPAPYIISPGRVGYREDEIEAWRASRDVRGRTAPVRYSGSDVAKPPMAGWSPRPTISVSCPAPSRSAEAPARRTATAAPSPIQATLKPVRRRRTEHARAIAQQILFDF